MKLRLFIGIKLSAAAAVHCAALSRKVEQLIPPAGGRCISPNQLHLTLRFIGAVEEERAPLITRLMDGVASRNGAGALLLGGLGAFPQRGPVKIIWVAASSDPPALLASIAGDLEDGLRLLGFSPEERELHPHITLARLKHPLGRDLRRVLSELPSQTFTQPLEALELFRSELQPGGSRYHLVHRAALGQAQQNS